ncbi:nucleoside monophosphate kinase [Streptomyces goshikiensis]|uniref:nucleoside monophosphate kinase n=1 Tax=Streptomyces goshikiensis TaxID=1942 RepID=UPI002E2D21A4|nr:nucleoside monophosphate kinase [Streptomyces goshikiensis]
MEPTARTSPEGAAVAYSRALAVFADDLHELYVESGVRSYAAVEAGARSAGRVSLSTSSISEALHGKRLPSLDFTLELVRQLAGDQSGVREAWRQRWKQMRLLQRRVKTEANTANAAGDQPGLPLLHQGTVSSAHDEAAQIIAQAQEVARSVIGEAREQADQILRAIDNARKAQDSPSSAVPDAAKLRQRESLRIVLMGPPSAGKGTQAALLARQLQLPHVSIGDIYRKNISEGTTLGLTVKECLEAEEVIPDEAILGMLAQRLDENDAVRGFLLDGVPRNLDQAFSLEALLGSGGKEVDVVLGVDVPHDEAIKRQVGRRICLTDRSHVFHLDYAPPKRFGICNVCGSSLALRDADSQTTTEQRWHFFETVCRPAMAYYSSKGRLVKISGLGKVQEVTANAISALAYYFDYPRR